MTYEMIEKRINELNEEITKAYNAVVDAEKFRGTTSKSKALLRKAEKLVDEKYELIDLLRAC